MKKSIVLLMVLAFMSTACFHKPHPHGCPPGQAKKGNCFVG